MIFEWFTGLVIFKDLAFWPDDTRNHRCVFLADLLASEFFITLILMDHSSLLRKRDSVDLSLSLKELAWRTWPDIGWVTVLGTRDKWLHITWVYFVFLRVFVGRFMPAEWMTKVGMDAGRSVAFVSLMVGLILEENELVCFIIGAVVA